MFGFNKEKFTLKSEELLVRPEFRWNTTEVYDKRGEGSKLLKTEKVLEYRLRWNEPWNAVWSQWNNPIYIEDDIK